MGCGNHSWNSFNHLIMAEVKGGIQLDKVVKEHYQKHTITEIEHIPEHDQRKETLEFRNAKHELEKIEHLGCFVCGSMEHRESHHIFERCWYNALDLKRAAFLLFHHFDFHSHCQRDFKTPDDLYQYLTHFNDERALDTLYNQLILCKDHHQEEGTSVHGATFATFVSILAHKEGFDVSINPHEYEEVTHEKV
jgi:hypothetical protein